MSIPGIAPRRAVDVVSNTLTSLAITVGATILGMHGELAPEGVLGAYTIAAAVSGLPIVVRRDPGNS